MPDLTPAQEAAANRIKIYQLDKSQGIARAADSIGPVEAWSCKRTSWDHPPTKGDAIQKLKAKAVLLNADAVIDVSFDTNGKDIWGANCLKSIHASGWAVRTRP